MTESVAAQSPLEVLLEIQAHDTLTDQLRHRREALPARAELAASEARAVELGQRLDGVRAQRDEVAAVERRHDDEARSIEAKAAEVEKKLYSGEVSSPKELQAMQTDIEQLRRHQRAVEDRELETMEQRETLDSLVNALETEAASLAADRERLRTAIAADEAVIDDELAAEAATRVTLAAQVPDDLVADYERRRVQGRGVGIARLIGRTCQACHLEIPATEAEHIRKNPPGPCDNCGALLVP
jgi:hypothetical protein